MELEFGLWEVVLLLIQSLSLYVYLGFLFLFELALVFFIILRICPFHLNNLIIVI